MEGNQKNPVAESTYGQFYGGDCYIVLYSYKPRNRMEYLLYYWIGSKSTKDEITALPILTVKTDEEECNGAATQVRGDRFTLPFLFQLVSSISTFTLTLVSEPKFLVYV